MKQSWRNDIYNSIMSELSEYIKDALNEAAGDDDNFEASICSVPGSYLNKAYKQMGFTNQNFNNFNIMVLPTENVGSITKHMIRAFAFIKFKGTDDLDHYIIYYTSSGSGGKKETEHGSWYPIFGIAQNKWLVKTNGRDMTCKIDGESAPYNNRKLGQIKDFLDEHYPIQEMEEQWQKNIQRMYNYFEKQKKYPGFLDMTAPEKMIILRTYLFNNILQHGKVVYAGDMKYDGNEFFPEYHICDMFNYNLFDIMYMILQWYSDLEFKQIPVKNHHDVFQVNKRIKKILDVLN